MLWSQCQCLVHRPPLWTPAGGEQPGTSHLPTAGDAPQQLCWSVTHLQTHPQQEKGNYSAKQLFPDQKVERVKHPVNHIFLHPLLHASTPETSQKPQDELALWFGVGTGWYKLPAGVHIYNVFKEPVLSGTTCPMCGTEHQAACAPRWMGKESGNSSWVKTVYA